MTLDSRIACSASFGPAFAAVDMRTALRLGDIGAAVAYLRRDRDTEAEAVVDVVDFLTGRVTVAEAVVLARTALVDLDVDAMLARAAESLSAPGTTPTNPELIFFVYTLFLLQQQRQ